MYGTNPWHFSNRIPLELVLKLINDVKTDRDTLLACLQVCRSWHSFAVCILYEPLYILNRNQLLRLAYAAHRYPAVRNRLTETRSIFVALSQHSPKFYHVVPLILYPYVPRVERISFLHCFSGPTHPVFFAALPHFATVRQLLLFRFSSNFGDFLRVVYALLCLERLEVHDSCLRAPPSTAPPHYCLLEQHKAAHHLKSLMLSRLEPKFLEILMKWAVLSGVHRTIQSLDVVLDFYEDFCAAISEGSGLITEFLAHSAASIQYLRLKNIGQGMCSSVSTDCALLTAVRLPTDGGCPYDAVFAQFTRLQILNMEFKTHHEELHLINLVESIYDILVEIPEPTLHQITFRLDFTGFIGATDHDISRIRLLMEYPDQETQSVVLEKTNKVEERPCFRNLTCAEILLHFRYDNQRWDVHTARNAGDYFLERMRAFFVAWECRDILTLTCSTVDGTYSIPKTCATSPSYQ